MGKNKRLPNDIVLAALQLVRGQARRKAEYKRQVDEIILRSGTNFVDTTTSCGTPVRVYLPHAGGNSNDIRRSSSLRHSGMCRSCGPLMPPRMRLGPTSRAPQYGLRCKRLLHSTAMTAVSGRLSA